MVEALLFLRGGEEAGDEIDHVLSDSCSLLSLTDEVCAVLKGSFESPRYK